MSKKPTHEVFMTRKYENGDGEEKTFWTKIGAAWTHSDNKGFNVSLQAMPFDGELTLRKREEKGA